MLAGWPSSPSLAVRQGARRRYWFKERGPPSRISYQDQQHHHHIAHITLPIAQHLLGRASPLTSRLLVTAKETTRRPSQRTRHAASRPSAIHHPPSGHPAYRISYPISHLFPLSLSRYHHCSFSLSPLSSPSHRSVLATSESSLRDDLAGLLTRPPAPPARPALCACVCMCACACACTCACACACVSAAPAHHVHLCVSPSCALSLAPSYTGRRALVSSSTTPAHALTSPNHGRRPALSQRSIQRRRRLRQQRSLRRLCSRRSHQPRKHLLPELGLASY